MEDKKLNKGNYLDEEALNEVLREFYVKFGIIDEGKIVADDDYEKSVPIDIEDMNLRRA